MKTGRSERGFTFVEVIVILIIMGIIAVVAATRMMSTDNSLVTVTDTLTSQLRLAQARAMDSSMEQGTQGSWGIRFISSTQYHLFHCATAVGCDPAQNANREVFPGADALIMDISGEGVQVTNGALVIAFNRFGTPYSDGTLTTLQSNPLTLTLRDRDGRTRTITITPQTGMIL